MVPGGDEQERGGAGPDPVQGEQARGAGGDQGDDGLVQAAELAVEASCRRRVPVARRAGIARDVAGAAAARRSPATRAAGVCRVGRLEVIGPGQDQGPGLFIVRVRSPAALRLATISARIASTAPSRPLGAPRPGRTGRPASALTASEGVGLALSAAVLAVRAVHLDDPPDACCGGRSGPARRRNCRSLRSRPGTRSRTRPASPAGRSRRPRWRGTPGRRAGRRPNQARRRRAYRRESVHPAGDWPDCLGSGRSGTRRRPRASFIPASSLVRPRSWVAGHRPGPRGAGSAAWPRLQPGRAERAGRAR